jgi:diguanylate cyclase (GGDEF)-like protein
MLDLDDFKLVNDTFGHKIGDRMLREMGRIVQNQLREYDFLARYAGDEFVAIVQELVGNQVEDLKTRIESSVSEFSLHVRGNGDARVGISVGTATFGLDGETLYQLLVAADQAMYRAKSDHRLAKISHKPATASPIIVELETDDLASISVN